MIVLLPITNWIWLPPWNRVLVEDVVFFETTLNNYSLRSVLTIAFQFTFENHYQDSVVAMARQYVRSIVGFVQRVVNAISPSRLSSQPKSLHGFPKAATLAWWICRSYRNMLMGIYFFFFKIHKEALLIWGFLNGLRACQADQQAGGALIKNDDTASELRGIVPTNDKNKSREGSIGSFGLFKVRNVQVYGGFVLHIGSIGRLRKAYSHCPKLYMYAHAKLCSLTLRTPFR
ncbi:hypothetical protein IFM89_004342 [Coptis chinensis]|uniref:Uncharacterized protein n=1 Tax=Coptis chinensis TaxID=261450 RepID=A0A835M6X0_9MAGN|nr:hypothetical protein IFM89_004342 [Coptis chinensis]